MPLERCVVNGKRGWRYGKHGHCYTGKDAKKKAIKQGVAENYSRQKRGLPPEEI